MALLTDLLSTNTTDIAANATAVASAGGTTLLQSVDVSNVSSTTLTLSSGYDSFLLVLNRWVPTANANFFVRPRSTSVAPSWRYRATGNQDTGTGVNPLRSTNNSNGVQLNPYTITSTNANSDFSGWSGTVRIFGALDTDKTYLNLEGFFIDDNSNGGVVQGAGRSNTSMVTDKVEIFFNVNTLSGSAKLYGFKA